MLTSEKEGENQHFRKEGDVIKMEKEPLNLCTFDPVFNDLPRQDG